MLEAAGAKMWMWACSLGSCWQKDVVDTVLSESDVVWVSHPGNVNDSLILLFCSIKSNVKDTAVLQCTISESIAV